MVEGVVRACLLLSRHSLMAVVGLPAENSVVIALARVACDSSAVGLFICLRFKLLLFHARRTVDMKLDKENNDEAHGESLRQKGRALGESRVN